MSPLPPKIPPNKLCNICGQCICHNYYSQQQQPPNIISLPQYNKMVSSSRRFLIAVAAFALCLSGMLRAEARTISSSQSQPQRYLASGEGALVRGMMSADSQFGLYMTVNDTSRGGCAGEEDVERGGPMTPMHKARDTAVNFAAVVRRRAFSPVRSRRAEQGGQ